MPIDPVKRLENWDTKYNIERVTAILTSKRPKMLERMGNAIVALSSMENQVKQVCDGSGVSTILYPFYLSFGREMWSLRQKEISGESMAKEVAVLVTKWTARGLTQAVLQAIRTDVFDVAAPVAP
ncbi:MAG: hypothetical protein NTX53_20020 [candidate division WOR-3 bacterium]|nr:hypothetical protein [candidate division WOR-3 bacterium]